MATRNYKRNAEDGEPGTTKGFNLYSDYKKQRHPNGFQLPKPNFVRVKVISMGESDVGKSCLIKRYCEEKFVAKYISTIGVDFGVKKVSVGGNDVKVNFFDLSGHPEFFEVRNEFYKDTQGAILVYDVGSKKTFDALDMWVSEYKRYGGKNSIVVAVCGNKVDGKRVVSEKDGKDWAAKNGFLFFETSAMSGENVNEMFDMLFKSIIRQLYDQTFE